MNTNEAVRERIKDLCEQNKISVYALALRAAIPKSTLQNIMSGKTNPKISTICKISHGFGLSLDEFFQAEEFKICEEE